MWCVSKQESLTLLMVANLYSYACTTYVHVLYELLHVLYELLQTPTHTHMCTHTQGGSPLFCPQLANKCFKAVGQFMVEDSLS